MNNEKDKRASQGITTDGIIFTPIYENYKNNHIYKWKPIELLTIDLRVIKKISPGRPDRNTRNTRKDGNTDRKDGAVKTSSYGLIENFGDIHLSGLRIDQELEEFEYYLAYMIPTNDKKNIHKIFEKENNTLSTIVFSLDQLISYGIKDLDIVEFSYEDGILIPHRVREDKKISGPNFSTTVNSIWNHLTLVGPESYPIDSIELIQRLKSSVPFNDTAVKQLHGNYKRKLIERYTKNKVVLDLGGGYGGDIHRYRKAGAKHVYFVEPNTDNIVEFIKRHGVNNMDANVQLLVDRPKNDEYKDYLAKRIAKRDAVRLDPLNKIREIMTFEEWEKKEKLKKQKNNEMNESQAMDVRTKRSEKARMTRERKRTEKERIERIDRGETEQEKEEQQEKEDQEEQEKEEQEEQEKEEQEEKDQEEAGEEKDEDQEEKDQDQEEEEEKTEQQKDRERSSEELEDQLRIRAGLPRAKAEDGEIRMKYTVDRGYRGKRDDRGDAEIKREQQQKYSDYRKLEQERIENQINAVISSGELKPIMTRNEYNNEKLELGERLPLIDRYRAYRLKLGRENEDIANNLNRTISKKEFFTLKDNLNLNKSYTLIQSGAEYTDYIYQNVQTQVDVVSMFFSMSFFFSDRSLLRRLADTIDRHLKRGGVFIGVTIDGDRMRDLLDDADYGEKVDTGYAEIQKLYRQSGQSGQSGRRGYGDKIKINIKSSRIVTDQTEWLVYLNELEKLLSLKGINRITDGVIRESDHGYFNGSAYPLTEGQKKYVQMNRAFVFLKEGAKEQPFRLTKQKTAEPYVFSLGKELKLDRSAKFKWDRIYKETDDYELVRIGIVTRGSTLLHGVLHAIGDGYLGIVMEDTKGTVVERKIETRTQIARKIRGELADLVTERDFVDLEASILTTGAFIESISNDLNAYIGVSGRQIIDMSNYLTITETIGKITEIAISVLRKRQQSQKGTEEKDLPREDRKRKAAKQVYDPAELDPDLANSDVTKELEREMEEDRLKADMSETDMLERKERGVDDTVPIINVDDTLLLQRISQISGRHVTKAYNRYIERIRTDSGYIDSEIRPFLSEILQYGIMIVKDTARYPINEKLYIHDQNVFLIWNGKLKYYEVLGLRNKVTRKIQTVFTINSEMMLNYNRIIEEDEQIFSQMMDPVDRKESISSSINDDGDLPLVPKKVDKQGEEKEEKEEKEKEFISLPIDDQDDVSLVPKNAAKQGKKKSKKQAKQEKEFISLSID
jgi:SAM-dependent methyltransferase